MNEQLMMALLDTSNSRKTRAALLLYALSEMFNEQEDGEDVPGEREEIHVRPRIEPLGG